jgi:bacteriorhodopsin
MTEDVVVSSFGNLTLVLLVIALGIFAWLTAKSRNSKSFQFQISLFLVIWIVGEIVDLLGEEGVIEWFASSEIAMYIHVLAMGLFSAMLWTRFYLAKRSGKKMTETFQES